MRIQLEKNPRSGSCREGDRVEHALKNLRVLDLTRVLAGPWCTQLLADLGADVIKIERPGSGDDARHWGPPYLKDRAGNDTADAAYFLCANRNKRSVTVDVAAPEGQRIVRALAQRADIVVENYRVGQLHKYGLDAASLRADNPRLIYCSITGFGQDGPYKDRPGYDFVIQAMCGLMSVTGAEAGGGPQKVGVAVTDLMTGMYAAVAILAAVAHRERTGEGQVIDMALFDSAIAMMANVNANYLLSGRVPQRWGSAHPTIVPHEAFECSDGWIVLAVGNDAQFERFCDVLGRPDLAGDARFATNSTRVRNRELLRPQLREVLRQQPGCYWLQRLTAAGVPCGPIQTVDQALTDPHALARGMRIDVPHERAGSVPLIANPIKMSATPPSYGRAPPRLGEHTDEVLTELAGLERSQIEALRAQGIV
jgi:crotonobetainyl-CoA:carnitine CoA-transferase CaiB-like acyl-CoA transferase